MSVAKAQFKDSLCGQRARSEVNVFIVHAGGQMFRYQGSMQMLSAHGNLPVILSSQGRSRESLGFAG